MMRVISGDVELFRSNELSEVLEYLQTMVGKSLPGPDITVTNLPDPDDELNYLIFGGDKWPNDP